MATQSTSVYVNEPMSEQSGHGRIPYILFDLAGDSGSLLLSSAQPVDKATERPFSEEEYRDVDLDGDGQAVNNQDASQSAVPPMIPQECCERGKGIEG